MFEQWLRQLGMNPDTMDAGDIQIMRGIYDGREPREAVAARPTQPGDPLLAPAFNPRAIPASGAAMMGFSAPDPVFADLLPPGGVSHAGIEALVAEAINNRPSSAQQFREIGRRAASENWPRKRVELELLRMSRTTGLMHTTPRGEGTGLPEVLAASFAMTCGASEAAVGRAINNEQVMNVALSRPHRGASYHSIIRAVLQSHGRAVPLGRVNDTHLRECFALAQHEQHMMPAAAAGPSTMSLPGILSDAARKLSLASFIATPVTWPKFCRVVDLADFKTHHALRLLNAGSFEKLAPAGEIKHGALSESDAELAAETYAELINIDRKDLINDDLNKFGEVGRILGRNGSVRVEKNVYTLLLSGVTANFFSAANGNYNEGAADSLLDLTGLTVAEAMFLGQLDSNGDPALITPEILLVPPLLGPPARVQMTSQKIVDGTATGAQPDGNPFEGRFEPVIAPFLGTAAGLAGASDKAWYLLAGPNDFACIAVGFLDGIASPTIEMAALDFSRLGLSIRGYIDFDCAFLEPKGGVKSKGEA